MNEPTITRINLIEEPETVWTHGYPELDKIALYFNEGDAGKIMLTKELTAEMIAALQNAQIKMGWVGSQRTQ